MTPSDHSGTVYTIPFTSYRRDLPPLLDRASLADRITGRQPVLIKPNLAEALLPPITTPVELVEVLVDYLQSNCTARIIIGEGTGALSYDTWHPFNELGYSKLAADKRIELIDLNEEHCIKRSCKDCKRWPELYLPEIACESFLISVPMLKAHTLAKVTLTMKNMMGLVPPSHYRQGSNWKKSAFHDGIQEAVADLNRYRSPDFTLLDATVGMARAHLYGPTCDPPVGILAASHDPVAIDAYGTGLLKRDWRTIGHIASVHGELGQAEPLSIVSAGHKKIG